MKKLGVSKNIVIDRILQYVALMLVGVEDGVKCFLFSLILASVVVLAAQHFICSLCIESSFLCRFSFMTSKTSTELFFSLIDLLFICLII